MPKAKKVGDQFSVLVYMGKDEKGKKVYKRVSDYDQDIAERKASELKIQNKHNKILKNKITVGEAIENYISNKSNIMSPSTIKGYRSMQANHYESICDKLIQDLTIPGIQKFVNEESFEHSPKTVSNIYGLLTAAINECYPNFSFKGIKMPHKIKTDVFIPTDEMVIRCLTASEGTDLHTAILLAAYLGLRRSEIRALKKSDINFDNKTVSINKAVVLDTNNNEITKSPKSYAGKRIITAPDFVIKELKKIKTDTLVNMKVPQITNKFGRLVRKLGYNFKFHNLRHYNASIMLMLNIPNKYAQERIGHATDEMLRNVYQHTITKKQQEVSSTLNAYFAAQIAETTKSTTKHA